MQGFHQRQYIIQVPRKRPPKDVCKFDIKGRQWIKANEYQNTYTQWEHSDLDYYVWFKKGEENAPNEGEFIEFKGEDKQWQIASIWRYRSLLRCVVVLQHI